MQGTSSRAALRTYASQLTFPVLILAAITGVLFYTVQYLHDPDWGADAYDSLHDCSQPASLFR